MKEIWKDVRGFEGLYQVSNLGKVKAMPKNRGSWKAPERMIKLSKKKTGYLEVPMCKNNKRKYQTIHTLVWDHFGNKPRNGRMLQVDHVDNNKENNVISNLQLLTARDNMSKDRDGSSRFTGAYWAKDRQKWRSEIKVGNKRIMLGQFDSEAQAGLAYLKAKLKYTGAI